MLLLHAQCSPSKCRSTATSDSFMRGESVTITFLVITETPLWTINNSGVSTAISDKVARTDRRIRSGFPSTSVVSASDIRHLTKTNQKMCEIDVFMIEKLILLLTNARSQQLRWNWYDFPNQFQGLNPFLFVFYNYIDTATYLKYQKKLKLWICYKNLLNKF